MQTRTTHREENSRGGATLYIAFDLGHRTWCLRFSDGSKVRDVQMPSRDLLRLEAELETARTKFCLPRGCRMVSCYEAGWDGFWLHRYLRSHGVENMVVDSSSIEVNRRGRRAKTDRLDVKKLLTMLLRHDQGERVWSVVQVPSVEEEDARQPHRELERVKRERRRHGNRLLGLLVTQGITLKTWCNLPAKLESLRLWDGTPLPVHLKQALLREWARLAKAAGMKYMVMTTKHHEGFCLWDSALTDYKAPNTPAGRDLLRPMVDAFRERNVRVGLYHSLIDWHHPDYVLDPHIGPYRDHPDREKLNVGRQQARYAEYLHGQVRELLTQFGQVDILWCDFSYPSREGYAGKGRGNSTYPSGSGGPGSAGTHC